MAKNVADYSGRWESYWQHVTWIGSKAKVLWDSVPERAALEDLSRFKQHLDEDLPLVDLGCGNGRQTRFLARHFSKVIGVDVSPAAVELARQQTVAESNVEYRVLDALSRPEAEALHREFGDMNVYMRGVLHGIQRADRPSFIAGLEILLGERGTLYQIEVTTKGRSFLSNVACSNLFVVPVGFDNSLDKEACYPEERWQVVEQGQDAIMNTVDFATGEEQAMPVDYLIVRRKVQPSS